MPALHDLITCPTCNGSGLAHCDLDCHTCGGDQFIVTDHLDPIPFPTGVDLHPAHVFAWHLDLPSAELVAIFFHEAQLIELDVSLRHPDARLVAYAQDAAFAVQLF